METSEQSVLIPSEDFHCKLKLCVICAEPINHDEENMLSSDEGSEATNPSIFLTGITILCDKLGVNDGKYGSPQFWGLIGVVENFVRLVCCTRCLQLLKELVELQELILTTQKTLAENVDKVATCLIESEKCSGDAEFSINSCFLFRQEVLSNYYEKRHNDPDGPTSQAPVRRKVHSRTTGPASSKRGRRGKVRVANDVELNSCFVKLERVDTGHSFENTAVSQVDNEGDDDNQTLMESSDDSPFSPTERVEEEDDVTDEDFKPYSQRGREKPRKKRGRPMKRLSKEETVGHFVKRKRGRPPKVAATTDEIKIAFQENVVDIPNSPEVGSPNQTSEDEHPPEIIKRTGRKSRPRDSERPVGRPRKELFPITVEQAKELISDGSSIKPFVVINPDSAVYSYSNVRIQRDHTTLLCKHPDCDFFVGDMAYFSDQLAFRTMKLHIKYHHRLRNYRIYPNSEKSATSAEPSASFYCCCYCEKQFRTKNNLLDHVRQCHGNAEPLLTLCEVCGESMPPAALSKHLYDHKNADEKEAAIVTKPKLRGRKKDMSIPLQFPCDQCDKVFRNQTQLRIHRITHIPLEIRKQFQCDICGDRLTNHNTLRYHKQRVHFKEDMEYPFVCNICNRKFNHQQRSVYEDHLRLHTGERPYQCSECGKGFHRKRNLANHERLHQEDTKVQCEFCSEWYKNQRYLRRHQLKHHSSIVSKSSKNHAGGFQNIEYGPDFIGPKMAHPCEPCGKIYVFKSQLVAHMKHRHKLFLPTSGDYPDQNTFETQELRDLQKANPAVAPAHEQGFEVY